MQESQALYPLLNVDDVYGTLYSPGDGTVTPEVCTGLARAAVRAGAVVAEGRRVKEIRQERFEYLIATKTSPISNNFRINRFCFVFFF